MTGAGGMAGMGGSGGMGGAGGAGGAVSSGCKTAMDCPTLPNSIPYCDNGKCDFTCKAGFGDCTVGAGCETVVTDNKTHCGACNKTCVAYCEGLTCNDPVSIAGGYHHHCAVMKNGDVYCWGRNEKGELGDGSFDMRLVPTKVQGLPGPAVQVDGGASASAMNYTPKTCAVLVSGDLWCWGEGSAVPAKVNGLSNMKEVSVGDSHTCAVSKTGVLYCWGTNNKGQVGNNGAGYVVTPTEILTAVASASAGGQHTCSVMTSGALQCWGDNANGQLGNGTVQGALSPAVVNGVANAIEVRAGDVHTCAIIDSALYCWGSNQYGQLGSGNFNQSTVPKLIKSFGVTGVDASYNFGGMVDGSTIAMWGHNSLGQLGNGSMAESLTPTTIGTSEAKLLRLGSVSSCALLVSGQIRCWGGNTYGQLGNGGNQQKSLPTPIVWPL